MLQQKSRSYMQWTLGLLGGMGQCGNMNLEFYTEGPTQVAGQPMEGSLYIYSCTKSGGVKYFGGVIATLDGSSGLCGGAAVGYFLPVSEMNSARICQLAQITSAEKCVPQGQN